MEDWGRLQTNSRRPETGFQRETIGDMSSHRELRETSVQTGASDAHETEYIFQESKKAEGLFARSARWFVLGEVGARIAVCVLQIFRLGLHQQAAA